MWFDVLCTPLHAHLRWGVALVGKFSTRHCSPHRREIFFQVPEVQNELKQVQETYFEKKKKKVGLWPIKLFCNIMYRISTFDICK